MMTGSEKVEKDYTDIQRYSILISAMLGYILEFYDVLIFPFLMPNIQKTLALSAVELGSLQTLTLFASAIGGPLFGMCSDRFGRKTSLQFTIALFSIGALASAFSWNYWSLATLRFITGIGLGGEVGAGLVLFNEAWTKKNRGLGSAALQGCAVIASSGASIVGIWLTSSYSTEWSWRLGLLSGGAPILLIIFIRFFMPESKIWLEYKALKDAGRLPASLEAKHATLIEIFCNGFAPQTIVSIVWMMCYMLCYYSILSFIPKLLLGEMHTPPDVVRTTAILLSIIAGIAYLLNGFFNDRVGRRWGAVIPGLFWIGSLVGMSVWGHQLYAGSKVEWPMFWLYIIFGIGNVSLGVVGVWVSELYPVHLRATAVSTTYMVGRGLGSVAPILVPIAADHLTGGLLSGMIAVALPAVLVFLAASFLLPETLGRDLSARTSLKLEPGRIIRPRSD
jgi:MFS family permease